MGDDQFLNAQVDEDTELWTAFAEFKEQKGYESKSEAVRAAVRAGVMDEDEDELSTDELRELMQQQQRNARVGLWQSSILTTALLLAVSALVVGLSSLLVFVPTTEAAVISALLLVLSVACIGAVRLGWVEKVSNTLRDGASNSPEVAD